MKKLAFITLLIITCISCNTQKVNVDYDRNVDFSQIRTYQIDESVSSGLNELDQKRLFDAIQQNLKFRGVRNAESSDIYLRISPREYVSSNTNSSVGVGLGTGIGRVLGGGISVGIPVTSKKLNQEYVVTMYQNNSLIWEGILNLQMPLNASADVKQQSIEKGVSKLFKNYPPKK